MSNYVNNMIICPKEFFCQYILDNEAFENNQVPNISFNKLFNVKSLQEYYDKIGTAIYYGWGFSYISRSDGKCVVKFQTRSFYPIEAIMQAIKISHLVEWYAVEENFIYVSKFYWEHEIKEDILYLGDDYDDWIQRQIDYDDSIFEENESDCGAWYYLRYSKNKWRECQRIKDPSIYTDRDKYVKYPFE